MKKLKALTLILPALVSFKIYAQALMPSALVIPNEKSMNSSRLLRSQLARQKAINFLEQNNEERTHRFGTTAEFSDLKKNILAGKYSSQEIYNKKYQKMFSSQSAAIEELGNSILKSENFADRLKTYSFIYKNLPSDIKIKIDAPIEIQQSAELDYNFSVLYNEIETSNQAPFSDPFSDLKESSICDFEVGAKSVYGDGDNADDLGDQSAKCSLDAFNPKGLMLNNHFTLRDHQTCVKNQGGRGTCVAFTINAAIETQHSFNTNVQINLSEQFTFAFGKIYSESGNDRYQYGLKNENTLEAFIDNGVTLQLEKKWWYNSSMNMGDYNRSTKRFPNSCDNYEGSICTNYSFQAKEEEVDNVLVYTLPSRSRNGYQVTDYVNLYNVFDKRGSLLTVVSMVNAGVPVLAGFDVREYYLNKRDANRGYVRFQRHNDANLGGHGALIVGYISNNNLPRGVKEAEENGYFIIKNSWGLTGDCGYDYVDFKYLRKEITSLHSIDYVKN